MFKNHPGFDISSLPRNLFINAATLAGEIDILALSSMPIVAMRAYRCLKDAYTKRYN